MLQLVFVLVLPSLVLPSSTSGPADWVALEVPALCAPQAPAAHPEALLDGSHLMLRPRGHDEERDAPPAKLPQALVLQILEDDARSRGAKLEFLRSSPALIARGSDEALAGARALLRDLALQGERLEIELSIELVGRGPGGEQALRTKARARSGEELFLGARRTRAFVAGFDVEVAADSGVAQPILGSAFSGPSVHLTAARVEGGRRVHLSGFLDLAELLEVARFDPDTPDLGVLEEPAVQSVQLAFSGVIDSGGTLEVTLAGAPLAQRPDWRLAIQASARPDPETGGEGAGWTMLDLAFLASEARALEPATPGGQLAKEGSFGGVAASSVALAPAAIAGAAEGARGPDSGARGARTALYWTHDLLFVPRGDAPLMKEVRALIKATEGARLASGRVEFKRGAFSVSLPCSAGQPARVLALREQPFLTEYRSELAPQTWMPSPELELVRDGFVLDLALQGEALSARAWSAASEAPLEVSRGDAQLGKLQQLRRALWTEGLRLAPKDGARTLFAAPPAGPGELTVALGAP